MIIVEQLLLGISALYVSARTIHSDVDLQQIKICYLNLGCVLLVVLYSGLSSPTFNDSFKHCMRLNLKGSLYIWMVPFLQLTNSILSNDDLYGIEAALGQTQVISILFIFCHIDFIGRFPNLSCSVLLTSTVGFVVSFLIGEMRIQQQVLLLFLSALFGVKVLKIVQLFPKTFSFGEGVMVCQISTSAFFRFICLWIFPKKYDTQASLTEHRLHLFEYVILILSTVVLLPMMTSILVGKTQLRHLLGFVFYTMAGLSALVMLSVLVYYGQLWTLITALAHTNTQVFLLLYWAGLSLTAVLLVLVYNKKHWQVTTVDRKYFHMISVMIFMPGLIYDPEFTKLASVLAFLIFILVEFVRYSQLPPFGSQLDSALQIFLDKQDAGCLVLTHIYLLLGCSLPLWFALPAQLSEGDMTLLSGITSLGIGDSFASIVGSRFGKAQYPGSKKTVEGTVAAWLSMTLFSYMLYLPAVNEAAVLSCKLLMVAILESCTQHIDNLVLPLYTYIVLLVV